MTTNNVDQYMVDAPVGTAVEAVLRCGSIAAAAESLRAETVRLEIETASAAEADQAAAVAEVPGRDAWVRWVTRSLVDRNGHDLSLLLQEAESVTARGAVDEETGRCLDAARFLIARVANQGPLTALPAALEALAAILGDEEPAEQARRHAAAVRACLPTL